MSSSTNELANNDGKRILDVEKEALFVISEALDALGDDFSIYGFSGYGRERALLYCQKILMIHGKQTAQSCWKYFMENGKIVMVSQFATVYKNYKRSNRSKSFC